MTSVADNTIPDARRHPRGLAFAVLGISGIANAMLRSSVAPALPDIQRDLHSSTLAPD